jgi:hypothetical protein
VRAILKDLVGNGVAHQIFENRSCARFSKIWWATA